MVKYEEPCMEVIVMNVVRTDLIGESGGGVSDEFTPNSRSGNTFN